MFTEDFKDECIEYCVEIEAPYYDLGCLSELSCEDLEFYSYDQCELQVLPSRECQEVCGIMADCARQRGKDVSRDEIEGCEQGCTRYASGTEMTCIINASSCVAAEACVNTGDIEQELTSTPLFSR